MVNNVLIMDAIYGALFEFPNYFKYFFITLSQLDFAASWFLVGT